jgi:hypothetical protein
MMSSPSDNVSLEGIFMHTCINSRIGSCGYRGFRCSDRQRSPAAGTATNQRSVGASPAISGRDRAYSTARAGRGRPTAERPRGGCAPAQGLQATLSKHTNLKMPPFRTSLRHVAPTTWREGNRINIGSSILRRLIRMTFRFEALILTNEPGAPFRMIGKSNPMKGQSRYTLVLIDRRHGGDTECGSNMGQKLWEEKPTKLPDS